jgi:hypothetical protein
VLSLSRRIKVELIFGIFEQVLQSKSVLLQVQMCLSHLPI